MKKLLIVMLLLSAPLFAQERNMHVTIWASQVEMQGDPELGDSVIPGSSSISNRATPSA
jgi:hypothetical protein